MRNEATIADGDKNAPIDFDDDAVAIVVAVVVDVSLTDDDDDVDVDDDGTNHEARLEIRDRIESTSS